jgi:glycosyltransferase involved in cell wall biosynthesis
MSGRAALIRPLSPPKVLHLTSGHGIGDARVFQKECRSLMRAGYQTSLAIAHEHDDLIQGIKIVAVRGIHGRLKRIGLLPWRLYWAALKEEAEVYHFHDAELLPVGLLLKAQGKRVVYDAHEDLPRTFLAKDYLKKWARRPLMQIAEKFEMFAARRFDAIVAATPVIGDRFLRHNARTVVVNNFPIIEEIVPVRMLPWSERNDWAVYLGCLTRDRGAIELVEAVNLISPKLNARLKIAGLFNAPNLHSKLQSLPGWKQVDWLGYLSRAGVAHLLGHCRVGVVVLAAEQAFMDSQPVKLYEYMAAGLPVVASDFKRWRRVVDGCGLLVNPCSPREIASAIEYLLTHPDEAEEMGKRGRAAVERLYNWNTEEAKLLHLYEFLVGAPERPVSSRVAPRPLDQRM